MKKGWLIIIALFVVAAMFANSTSPVRMTKSADKSSRYEVVAWSENFETGATGWTHYDGAVTPNNWHVYNADATQGNVWWMGDPALAQGANIGGYYDSQYLVLDTPARTITAGAPNLTFKLKYNVEGTAGAEAPYTGWDACNVRISTDGGTTWTPISGTPAYNMTASYAFGLIHNEGTAIPGWGGALTTWTNASFNLTAYVGQSVKIRFALGSDGAYSTGDAPAMFGMMVDDIAFGGYTNNGTDDGQMTWASMVPLGGDIWNVATAADAPSPTHVMQNQNETGSYNQNMLNYLVSPDITLPSTGAIRVDFMIKGDFTDPDAFPAVDWWGWEISNNNGLTWFAMSNPYGDPNGSNYVYSDAPLEWASATESYTLDGLISDYAGQTIKFRWYMKSDADTPAGTGIMIDDIMVYNDIVIAAPNNLTGTVAGANVTLNWDAPGELPPPVGFNDGFEDYTDFAATFTPWTTIDVDQQITYGITDVTFPGSGTALGYIIFNPSTTTPAITSVVAHGGAKMAASLAATVPPNNDWLISPAQEITDPATMLAFYAKSMTDVYGLERFKVGVSTTGTAPANFTIISGANYVEAPVDWTQFTYSLAAYVGQTVYIGIQCISNDAFIFFVDDFAVGVPAANREINRDVTGYKIYRDDLMLDEVSASTLTYTDMNVEGGLHNYYVTAMYSANESLASNNITVFVIPTTYVESTHDDSTAEQGFNVGATKLMAVKFNFTPGVAVKYAKVYVHTVNTAGLIVRIYNNNGTDGMPGSQSVSQVQYPVSSIVQGWNYIPFPDSPVIANGQFYIAIMETANACQIGLDTSSNGYSYKLINTTTGWEPVTTGNVMFHAICEGGTGIDDNNAPVIKFAANNYPNPFNPETTISFSIPKAGMTSIKVFNLKGQVVRTLVNGDVEAGNHSIVWNGIDSNGSSVASGVYFYRVTSNNQSITKKMLLTK